MADRVRTQLDPLKWLTERGNQLEDELGYGFVDPKTEDRDTAVGLMSTFIQEIEAAGREVREEVSREALRAMIALWARRRQTLAHAGFPDPKLMPAAPDLGLEETEWGEFVSRAGPGLRAEGWLIQDEAGFPLDKQLLDLTGAAIIDCRFVNCDFKNATLGPESVLLRTRFVNCRLPLQAKGIRVSSLLFDDCTFDGAVFDNATFGYSVFTSSPPERDQRGITQRLRNVSMSAEQTLFSACTISGYNFVNTNWLYSSFTECTLDGSGFHFSDFEGSTFVETSARNTDFRGATLIDVGFRNCDLEKADFGYAPQRFKRARARPAELRNTDFREAFNVTAAEFLPRQLPEAQFREEDEAAIRSRLERTTEDARGKRPSGRSK